MGVLSRQGVGKAHPPIAVGEILAMQLPHHLQMILQPLGHKRRQHRVAILASLALAHRDLQALKIQVFHP
ncbi:MAG: hypothetical protein FJ083_02555 [Cyanobacteria bacterium K_Offshore_surface_m2_239]|nr:hypothetical protein [Cyanobacteria bacterium K_Offshore_surface_m2_239]